MRHITRRWDSNPTAASKADRFGFDYRVTIPPEIADVPFPLDSLTAADVEAAAATHGRQLADELATLRHTWANLDNAPRRGSAPRRLLNHLIARPVLDAKTAADLLDTDPRQARRALDRLTDAEVLVTSGGSRHRTWRAQDVLDLLDRFHDAVETSTRRLA